MIIADKNNPDYVALVRRLANAEWITKRAICPGCLNRKEKGHKPTCWLHTFLSRELPFVGKSTGCSDCSELDIYKEKCGSVKLLRHEKTAFRKWNGSGCPYFKKKGKLN